MYMVQSNWKQSGRPTYPFLRLSSQLLQGHFWWPAYADYQTAANVWQQKWVLFYNKDWFMTGDCIGDMYLCGRENT